MGSLTITAELQPRRPRAAFVPSEDEMAIVGEGARRFPARTEINGAMLRAAVARMRVAEAKRVESRERAWWRRS